MVQKTFRNSTLKENLDRISGNMSEADDGYNKNMFTPDNAKVDIVIRFYEDRKSAGWNEPHFSFSGHMTVNGVEISIASNVIKPLSKWADIFGEEIPEVCIDRLNK